MSRQTSKNYVIGLVEQNGVEDYEFGETYHMALAMDLDPEIKVFINGKKDAEDKIRKNITQFLNLLGHHTKNGRILDEIPPERGHLPETWKIITEGQSRGVLESSRQRIWKKINDKAKDDQWVFPPIFEDLLKRGKKQKILIWSRNGTKDKCRDTTSESLKQLISLCKTQNTSPIITGKKPDDFNAGSSVLDLENFYNNESFDTNNIAKQLWFLDQLFEKHHVIASIGMMSGALDGPAFFAKHKTVFFANLWNAKDRMAHLANIISELNWLPLGGCSQKDKKLTTGELHYLYQLVWPEAANIKAKCLEKRVENASKSAK